MADWTAAALGRPRTGTRTVLASAELPGEWRARVLALLAPLQRIGTGDLDLADATAHQALASAEEAGDAFAAAPALAELWLTQSVRRDHATALEYIDRVLRMLSDDPGHPELRSDIFDVQRTAMRNRIFTLQNLDRWPEAELALRQTREFAQRVESPDSSTWATAAVLRYWLGQWDDALAELGSDDADAYSYLNVGWPALLVHGVAALIAGRREQHTTAGQHLRQGLALPTQNLGDRENQDFLVAAHALALEQGGETGQATPRLAAILPSARRRNDPDPPVAARPRPARARGRRSGGWPQLRRRLARPRPSWSPGRLGPPWPACGVDGLLESDPDATERWWHTTAWSVRQWIFPPCWRIQLLCWPGAATKTMPEPH